MSFRLRVLNSYLRSFVKPHLARAQSAEALRRGLRRGAAFLPPPPVEARFSDGGAAREDGPPLAWRWCRYGAAASDAPSAAILYLHGGAYVAGSPETHRSVIWSLAAAAEAPVAALDYRLAPEHPFPAAFEDAVAAFDALAAELGPEARIAIAGDSAGGALALAAAAALVNRGDGPVPAAIVAYSPFVDLALTGRSLERNARRDVMLPTARIAEAVEVYLAGAEPTDPRASPLYAEWRAAPPPALIQASNIEALKDDATRMAEALRRAGGDVRLEMWRATPHAWQFFAPWVSEAREAIESTGRFLRMHLSAED